MSGKSTTAIFDALAANYDNNFSRQPPAIWLRRQVQDRALSLLDGPSRILEVGCGTGEDAAFFADKGHTVIATDVSENMLQVAQKKIEQRKLGGKVSFSRIDLRSPAELHRVVDQPVDLVFANFGVLNCIAEPIALFREFGKFVQDGGFVALTVMGRFCAWETLYFLSRGKFSDAIRRWSGKSEYTAAEGTADVWYYTPGDIERAADQNFVPHSLFATGALIPPSYLFGWYRKWPRMFKSLQNREGSIERWRLASLISDHYQIILKKPASGHSAAQRSTR
jgi:ubiquinone/menaquinone biosynthesis C-methylase UbiE